MYININMNIYIYIYIYTQHYTSDWATRAATQRVRTMARRRRC